MRHAAGYSSPCEAQRRYPSKYEDTAEYSACATDPTDAPQNRVSWKIQSKADADDVFQEVFLAAYRKGITVKDNDEEKFWLIRTTLNQCKKITLSSWRRRTVPLEERKEEISFFRSREENDVFCAVTELPEKYRMVVYLYYFAEMSTDEIAEIMKVRSGTVRMQLTRAREMLKEKLKGGYFYE